VVSSNDSNKFCDVSTWLKIKRTDMWTWRSHEVALNNKIREVHYNKYKYCLTLERNILENCQTQWSIPSTAPYTLGRNSSEADILAWNSSWISPTAFLLYKQKNKFDTGIFELEQAANSLNYIYLLIIGQQCLKKGRLLLLQHRESVIYFWLGFI
jgi:hypothetical protein